MSTRLSIDPAWPKLRMVRRFAASPQAVFDAWTKPEMIRRWLFTAPDTNTVLDIDARVGGTWTIGDRRDGVDYTATGEYLEVEIPNKLVFTFAMPQFSPNTDRITVHIEADGAGSIMTFTQEGIDIAAELRQADPDAADSSEQGWSQMFELLAALLEEA